MTERHKASISDRDATTRHQVGLERLFECLAHDTVTDRVDGAVTVSEPQTVRVENMQIGSVGELSFPRDKVQDNTDDVKRQPRYCEQDGHHE